MNINKQDQEKAKLQSYILKAESLLKNAPPGTLRVSSSGNRILYYHYSKEIAATHKEGKYIPRKNQELAQQLAQKDYLESLLATATRLLNQMTRNQSFNVEQVIGNCYGTLSAQRKQLVIPLVLPDDLYADEWSNEEYRSNPFRTEALIFATERGEFVRSKSEKMIADKLFMMKIPYKYECPLKCGHKIFYPDFTMLNVTERKTFYLEHLGMLDNPEYSQNAVEKLNDYAAAGIVQGDSLLLSWETAKTPLDMKQFEALIRHYILT